MVKKTAAPEHVALLYLKGHLRKFRDPELLRRLWGSINEMSATANIPKEKSLKFVASLFRERLEQEIAAIAMSLETTRTDKEKTRAKLEEPRPEQRKGKTKK